MSTIRTSLNRGPLHTYPDMFENGDFFPPFSKKKRIHSKRIGTVLARPYENANQWKYDSIPYGACVMLVVNNL